MVFSSADGSGKSTASRALYVYLRLKGLDACLHRVRGSHLLASILLRFLDLSVIITGMQEIICIEGLSGRALQVGGYRLVIAVESIMGVLMFRFLEALRKVFCIMLGPLIL